MSHKTMLVSEWIAKSALVLSFIALLYTLAVLLLRVTVDLFPGDFWRDLRHLLAGLLLLFLLCDLGAIILGVSAAYRADLPSVRRQGLVAILGGALSLAAIWVGGGLLS